MHWAELREVLCDLYPHSSDAERVAQDAEVGTRYLTFDGTCTQVWERVMREANRRGKLLDVVRVAELEYAESAKVRQARVILEAGGTLREAPGEEGRPVSERRGDPFTDMILDAIGAVRDDVRNLREESERRGDKLATQVSDLRHETRNELTTLKPLVEAQGMQLRAHAAQLEAQATQMEAQGRRLESLEERPEVHANKVIIWLALLVGITAALSGDLLAALVARWFG